MRRSAAPYTVALAALVIALVLLVLATPAPSQDNDPSSRVAGRAGTLALYDWLGNLGFNVHRISGQFDTSGTDVLVISDPRTAISDMDAARVMAALAQGGDLILAVGPESQTKAAPLLHRLGITLSGVRPFGTAVPAQPIDPGDRVHRVPLGAGGAIAATPSLAPLLTQAGALGAVAERVSGGGRAYVLASPFPLSNDGLRDGDAATLVLTLLERARGGAIGFDEYHHGEVNAAGDGAAAIFESPLGLALLLGLVSVLVFLAWSGRRLGRPLPVGDAAVVPTTASYIDAMAGLYARSRDRGVVAARYAEELKQRLAAGPSFDPGPDSDGAFVSALQVTRPELAADAEALLRRARGLAAHTPDAAALLTLARDVDDLERRWAQPAEAVPAQWRP